MLDVARSEANGRRPLAKGDVEAFDCPEDSGECLTTGDCAQAKPLTLEVTGLPLAAGPVDRKVRC